MSVRCARRRVDVLTERIAILRSAMEGGERIQRNGSSSNFASDRLSRDMAKLDWLQRELAAAVLDYDMEKIILSDAISCLKVDEHQVVQMRYIDCLDWCDITRKTGLPMIKCYRLHKSALDILGL